MAVKVIVKRKVSKENREKVSELLSELRSKAIVKPGYITGETLINIDDPEDFIVISTWKSPEDWKNWLNSKERKEFADKIDNLLKNKTEYAIYLFG